MTGTLTPEQLEAYVMPRPARGESVLWYPHATNTETPEIAYVREVGKRGLTLNVNGVSLAPVRHITDPKLQLNQMQRETGAWDFTEAHHTNLQVFVNDLKDRLTALEKQYAALEDLLSAKKK